MEQVYVRCNNCNSDDYKIIFPANKAQIHQIVKCKKCGLMYANPQTTHSIDGKVSMNEPEKLDINELELKLKNFIPEKNQYLKKQYIQQKDYSKVLEYLDNNNKGVLLDIGSYAGVFLNSSRERGWNVIGIEPLNLPRLYSERKFGIKVLPTTFETSDLGNETIDVIVSFHVIEHIYNPKGFIMKCYSTLKKGGIMILETPTYDSFTFRLLRHKERSVRCDGHIFFFTRKTLKNIAESCGFKTIKQEKVGRTLTLDRFFHNIGIVTGRKVFFNKLALKMGFDKFTMHVNIGDMQRLYCKKI